MNLKTVKVGIIGDPTVGKSSLTNLYISNGQIYPRDYHMTTGVEIFCKIEEIEELDEDRKIMIYDFSGKDLYFNKVVSPFLNDIDVFLFVYDCTSRESFKNLNNWI